MPQKSPFTTKDAKHAQRTQRYLIDFVYFVIFESYLRVLRGKLCSLLGQPRNDVYFRDDCSNAFGLKRFMKNDLAVSP
jgi:hypothetical protein